MTTRVAVSIPAGGFSSPVSIDGQVVGALLQSTTGTGSGGTITLAYEVPVQDAAPYSAWQPAPAPGIAMGYVSSPAYGVPPAPLDLPPVVQFGLNDPGVAATVVLIIKPACSVSVSC